MERISSCSISAIASAISAYCFGLDVRYDSNLGYGDNGKPFPRNLRLQFGKWKMYRASSVGGERPSDATGETKIFLYAARHG